MDDLPISERRRLMLQQIYEAEFGYGQWPSKEEIFELAKAEDDERTAVNRYADAHANDLPAAEPSVEQRMAMYNQQAVDMVAKACGLPPLPVVAATGNPIMPDQLD